MINNGNPGNLIQLLAAYRRVQFPQDASAVRHFSAIAATIENNCAVTLRFTAEMLRKFDHDSEELFCLCSLREDALALRRACRALGPHSRRIPDIANRFVTLRSQYDTFVCSVRYLFFLLDRDLAGRIEGAL